MKMKTLLMTRFGLPIALAAFCAQLAIASPQEAGREPIGPQRISLSMSEGSSPIPLALLRGRLDELNKTFDQLKASGQAPSRDDGARSVDRQAAGQIGNQIAAIKTQIQEHEARLLSERRTLQKEQTETSAALNNSKLQGGSRDGAQTRLGQIEARLQSVDAELKARPVVDAQAFAALFDDMGVHKSSNKSEMEVEGIDRASKIVRVPLPTLTSSRKSAVLDKIADTAAKIKSAGWKGADVWFPASWANEARTPAGTALIKQIEAAGVKVKFGFDASPPAPKAAQKSANYEYSVEEGVNLPKWELIFYSALATLSATATGLMSALLMGGPMLPFVMGMGLLAATGITLFNVSEALSKLKARTAVGILINSAIALLGTGVSHVILGAMPVAPFVLMAASMITAGFSAAMVWDNIAWTPPSRRK